MHAELDTRFGRAQFPLSMNQDAQAFEMLANQQNIDAVEGTSIQVAQIIAGGMGQRAQDLFAAQNIQVIVGAPSQTPEKLIADFLAKKLDLGSNACDH